MCRARTASQLALKTSTNKTQYIVVTGKQGEVSATGTVAGIGGACQRERVTPTLVRAENGHCQTPFFFGVFLAQSPLAESST